jgi:hypothetical protein
VHNGAEPYRCPHSGKNWIRLLILLYSKPVPYQENRVVDPDWIRIQRLCGSGSVLGIRIPDPGVRKLRNFSGKMHFLVIFNKNFTTKKV